MPGIGQRRDADRSSQRPRPHRDARLRIGVRGGEELPVAPVVLASQYDLVRARALRGAAVWPGCAELDAAPALKGVIPPRAIMNALGHRLAELTVIRDVDIKLALMPHDIGDRRAQRLLKSGLLRRLPGLPGAVCLDQRVGPRQAANMAG